MVNDAKFSLVASVIRDPAVFYLEKHRRIWSVMIDLAEAGSAIDRVTIANALLNKGWLESVDGATYIVSLDDGIPVVSSVDSYVRILIEKWRLRNYVAILDQGIKQASSGEYDADAVSQFVQGKLADEGGYGSSKIESLASYIENYPGGINRLLDPQKRERGIPTGFSILDEWTDGMHESEIFLIGARPAAGKTALLCNVAKSLAKRGEWVAFFSLEMSKQQLIDRMMCEEANMSVIRFRRGELSSEDRASLRRALTVIEALPIAFDDSTPMTVPDMRVKLNTFQRERPIGLIVVDYVQLIKGKQKRYGTENDKFTEIAEDLQVMAKATKIPLLLASQLNRESEKATGDNRPRLAQCRGSGAWEQVANVGACLYREFTKKRERDDLRDVAELIVEKNRTGRGGTIKLKYTDWLMRFEDWQGVATNESTNQTAS